MASSSSKQRQAYHQDYVARIRYSNALPPPPNPPKLLDIPNTGLSSGQYTSAGFTSRLAREQPLNIEADAELGMPLDLVGMPGIFDGDESSIQPPPVAVPPHPSDRALLRPLATLGKPVTVASGVSFLRRTEYISSEQGKTSFLSTTSRSLVSSTSKSSRARASIKPSTSTPSAADLNDPLTILRAVNRGFDVAHPSQAYTGPDTGDSLHRAPVAPHERKNWDDPLHPRDKSLKLVRSCAFVPDLEAISDAGGYMTTKFATQPVPTVAGGNYDERLDVAMLHPLEESSRAKAPYYDYDLLLPEDANQVAKIRAALASGAGLAPVTTGGEDDDEQSQTQRSELFRYKRVRVYETAKTEAHHEQPYDEVIMAIKRPSTSSKSAASSRGVANYYPVLQRSVIRPRRNQGLARLGVGASQQQQQEEGVTEDSVEYMDVSVRMPNLDERELRASHLAKLEAEGGVGVVEG